ncbi:hypothetical protein AYI68_g1154 [Smittium mucronatum]|uniref:Uncharacterized protein n=1 Tax=Smittium mucronatum TaxID=133383 RepID=A0A1R0H6D4_9FUNG|nr:hypothetical protein AYI68_g1154 [Smittium mucronatum]
MEPVQIEDSSMENNTDEYWMIIKAYIEIRLVSDFVNRRELKKFRSDCSNRIKFDFLRQRIDIYERLTY